MYLSGETPTKTHMTVIFGFSHRVRCTVISTENKSKVLRSKSEVVNGII